MMVPWQAKMAGKILLSRIPAGYRFWRRVNLFRLGKMEEPEYAYDVFMRHFGRVDFPRKGKGFVALELGPGDSLFSAMLACSHQASSCYLVDSGRFAREDLVPYREMAQYLLDRGLPVPDLSRADSLDEVLLACRSRYGTEGIRSLREIPDRSVDFLWSHAVLEHVRLGEFLDTLRELRRVIRPDGICSHRIDLMDHLCGELNNLRFPEDLWESDFFAKSGFYTNRIRHSEMLGMFREAGFFPEVVNTDRWEKLPTPVGKMAMEYRGLDENQLRIFAFDVILRPL
jgi:predicted SAM-dependent methyltransferase